MCMYVHVLGVGVGAVGVMTDRGAITAGSQVKIKQFHGQSTFSLVSIRVKPHIPTAQPSSNFTQQ